MESDMIERLVVGLSGIAVGFSVLISSTPKGHITHWGALIASIFDILLGLILIFKYMDQKQ